jgi:hypothetical protein
MTYVHGQSRAAQAARELELAAREKAAKLAALNAEIDARIKSQEDRLRYLPKVRTYAPTPEQLAYREKHGPVIAAQPEPLHGGPAGLRRAADEMEAHERRKKQAA